jgi:hypothetical protein
MMKIVLREISSRFYEASKLSVLLREFIFKINNSLFFQSAVRSYFHEVLLSTFIKIIYEEKGIFENLNKNKTIN